MFEHGEDRIDIHSRDKLVKAGTILLIIAMGCLVYFYGMNQRMGKNNQQPSSMVKPLTDGFLHNHEIQ